MAKNDQLLGALDLLVLKTLSHVGSMHGYGIVLHIQRVSDDLLRVEEGSLYPALHRIEEAGWIISEWRASENNRRAKYYELSKSGRQQLEVETDAWTKLTAAVAQVLGTV